MDDSSKPAQDAGENLAKPDQGAGDNPPKPDQGAGDIPSKPTLETGNNPPKLDQSVRENQLKPDQGSRDNPPKPTLETEDNQSRPDQGVGENPSKPDQGSGENPPKPIQETGENPPKPVQVAEDNLPKPDQVAGENPSKPVQATVINPSKQAQGAEENPAKPIQAVMDNLPKPAQETRQNNQQPIDDLIEKAPGNIGWLYKLSRAITNNPAGRAVILTIGAILVAVVFLLGAFLGGPGFEKYLDLKRSESTQATVVAGVAATSSAMPTSAPTAVPVTPAAPTTESSPMPSATPVDISQQPLFDISIPWDAQQTNTFEVTDTLIGEASALSQPGNRYQVQSAGLELAIHPSYTGAQPLGAVDLLVSGAGGKTLTRPLWPSFSNAAQTQVVKLSLEEVITLSGVQWTSAKPESNLRLVYPKYPLKLEVIRAVDPLHPLAGSKTIDVVNEPWVAQTALAWRDGGWVLDYMLQNLGSDGTFGYQVKLVKTYGPVTLTGHPIYSGTVNVEGGGSENAIVLKQGETYTTTIPLGKTLPHGRYIAQAFTFKKMPYVTLDPTVTWENYTYHYLFASPDIDTVFVLCNDPGQSCEKTVSDPIEQHGILVYPFHITDFKDSGDVSYTSGAYAGQDRVITQHAVKYQLDPQKAGYAGIGIAFDAQTDFSAYNFLRFGFKFFDTDGDGQEPIVLMDIFFIDPATNKENVTRVRIGDGVYANNKGEPQTVVIPLKDLKDINLKQITKINILGDNTTVSDTKEHQFMLEDIAFVDMTPK